jgi:hypothetical protein
MGRDDFFVLMVTGMTQLISVAELEASRVRDDACGDIADLLLESPLRPFRTVGLVFPSNPPK